MRDPKIGDYPADPSLAIDYSDPFDVWNPFAEQNLMQVIGGRSSDGLDAAMSLFQLNWCAKFGSRVLDYDWYRREDHNMGSHDNVLIGLWWTNVSEWMRKTIRDTVDDAVVDSVLGSDGWRRKEYRHLFAAIEARNVNAVFEGDFQLLVSAPEIRLSAETYSISSMSFRIREI